jgi:3-oxoacyl-[acyl-carrier-protein] synthase III
MLIREENSTCNRMRMTMEMMDKLITEIRTIADFSAADIELFLSSFTEKFMDKGDHFLMEGQVSKHLGYIKSGLITF